MREILLVEQDRGLSDGIVLGLIQGPYRITQSFSMKEALYHIRVKTFSLIIMSLNLPDGRGIDLLSQIRRTLKTPVIVLTEKGLEEEQMLLDRENCIVKPVPLSQLKSKIECVWQKRKSLQNREYRFKSFSYRLDRGKVFRDTEEVRLSAVEEKLLKVLVENKGTAMSATALSHQIWNSTDGETVDGRLADAILSLRNKLEEDPGRPEMILTVSGKGYMFYPVNKIVARREPNPA